MPEPKELEKKIVEEEVEKEEVVVEEEEQQEEEETSLEEDANALRNREEDEINQKAIDEGDKQAQEDIADLLDLSDDEKKKAEEEEKEEKVEDKDKEEESKEEKKEEVEEKKEEIEEKKEEEDPLLAELGRLTALATGGEVPPKEKPKGEEEEKKEEEKPVEAKQQADEELVKALTTPVELEDQQYVSNEMFKENFDDTDRKQLNTIINQVVKKVREDTRNQTMQDAMKIFPGMMDYKMQGFMAAQEFWNRNPDLKSFCEKNPQVKQYVQFRSTEIQKQNPNATLSEVFTTTEKEVRGLLKGRLEKMKKQADSDKDQKVTKPGLVRKPGASRTTPVPVLKKDASEKEQIMELINFDQ